ncbi:MAG: hypothetical protein ACYC96_01995 [Fimbriimonadaceae bacterium]
MKNITATFGTLGLLATMLVAPMAANADSNDRHAPRENTRTFTSHVSLGSVLLGLLGLNGHNDGDDRSRGQDRDYRTAAYRENQDRIASYAQRRDDQRNRDNRNRDQSRGNQAQAHGRR